MLQRMDSLRRCRACFRRISLRLLLGLTVALHSLPVVPSGDMWAADDTRSYIVLDSGRVIEGTVRREGDAAVIYLNSGGIIRLPIAKVRAVAGSMREAFRSMQRTVAPADINGQLDLCEWCLRYKLYADAEQTLERLPALPNERARVDSIRRRLESGLKAEARLASQRLHDERQTSSPRQSPKDSTDGDAESALAATVERPEVSALRAETRTAFHQRVLPILINRCAAGGCHGKSGNGLLVQRAPQGQLVSRRLSDRNLERVAQYLDHRAIQETTLYRMAISDHTGQGAPLRDDDLAASGLAAWIAAWQRDAGFGPATSTSPSQGKTPDQAAPPSTLGTPTPSAEATPPRNLDENVAASPVTTPKADPYDPAPFNRGKSP